MQKRVKTNEHKALLLADLEEWTRGGGGGGDVCRRKRKPEVGAGISSAPRSAEEGNKRRKVEDNDAGGRGCFGVMRFKFQIIQGCLHGFKCSYDNT
jgi:hypothetical protein